MYPFQWNYSLGRLINWTTFTERGNSQTEEKQVQDYICHIDVDDIHRNKPTFKVFTYIYKA